MEKAADSVTVACAECGQAIDGLRAPAVRLTARRAFYFCSQRHADAFRLSEGPSAHDPGSPPSQLRPAKRELETVVEPALPSARPSGGEARPPTAPEAHRGFDRQAAPRSSGLTAKPDRFAKRRGYRLPLTWGFASLAMAVLALVFDISTREPDDTPWSTIGLVAAILALQVGSLQLSQRLRGRTSQAIAALRRDLQGTVRIDRGGGSEGAPSLPEDRQDVEVRPGEELLLSSGETLLVDALIAQGEGRARLWPDAREDSPVSEGGRLCAGARLVSGELKLICTGAGRERSIGPLVASGGQRLDRQLEASRWTWRIATQGAPLAALLGAGVAASGDASASEILGVSAALLAAFCSPLPGALVRSSARHWLLEAWRAGILYQRSSAVDRAGVLSTAVFCARGSVLHGEPEVTEIHALRDYEEGHVLALAAGAESVVEHPVATSVLRATHERGLSPDAARSHRATPGMGVVCLSSRGEPLVVGSRELLLRERISVAVAEDLLRTLESRGRTGLLVAEAGHLVGIVSLHDGLRPGARASVQMLLDAGIEPVLISGEARHTVEALARALAIEHFRPEIPAASRANEVKNLEAGGALVATIGTSPRDDGALAASHLPVVLDGATAGARLQGVTVLTPWVRDAARALLFPRKIRQAHALVLGTCYLPALAGSLAAGSLLVAAVTAPLFALAGQAVAALLLPRALRARPGEALTE